MSDIIEQAINDKTVSFTRELLNSDMFKAETGELWRVIEDWVLIQKLASDDMKRYDGYYLTWQQDLARNSKFRYSVNLHNRDLIRTKIYEGRNDYQLINVRIQQGLIEIEIDEEKLGKAREHVEELKRWEPLWEPFPTGRPGHRDLRYRVKDHNELRDFLFALDSNLQRRWDKLV